MSVGYKSDAVAVSADAYVSANDVLDVVWNALRPFCIEIMAAIGGFHVDDVVFAKWGVPLVAAFGLPQEPYLLHSGCLEIGSVQAHVQIILPPPVRFNSSVVIDFCSFGWVNAFLAPDGNAYFATNSLVGGVCYVYAVAETGM